MKDGAITNLQNVLVGALHPQSRWTASKMNMDGTSSPSPGAASEKGEVFLPAQREVLGISLSWEEPRTSLPRVPRKVNCRTVYLQWVTDLED